MLNSFFHLGTLLSFMLHFSGMPLPVIKNEAKLSTTIPTENAGPVKRLKKEDQEYIPWTYERPLTWNDFQCEPKRNSDAVASASTSLGIAYQIKNGQLVYQITCNFSKTKSWGLIKTDYILAHEQGHFDITEIFARKLFQALQVYKLNPRTYKQDINTIYKSIVTAKEAFQQAYDGETDHSRNKKAQYEWLERIDLTLEETEPFSAYP